jgi:hypothetical protein
MVCTALQATQRYHYVSCLKAANRQRKNFQTERSELSSVHCSLFFPLPSCAHSSRLSIHCLYNVQYLSHRLNMELDLQRLFRLCSVPIGLIFYRERAS